MRSVAALRLPLSPKGLNEGVLRHKENDGDVHTFAIEEIPWNITVDLYEKYLADLCKQPSMRSQGKTVHPRIGTHNREGDVPMLASYETIHRDGTVFLVHLQCEHNDRMQARAVSDYGRSSSEWEMVLKEELMLKQHVLTAANIDLLGADQGIKNFSSLREAFAQWLALRLRWYEARVEMLRNDARSAIECNEALRALFWRIRHDEPKGISSTLMLQPRECIEQYLEELGFCRLETSGMNHLFQWSIGDVPAQEEEVQRCLLRQRQCLESL
jgi:hypothetical protein